MTEPSHMGAIRVSPNGRYFVDHQGKPFFWLGDTLWELFCMHPAVDAEAILERRKEQGFTAILVMITGVGDGSKPNAAGETPWVGHDPAHPNEAYFRNVDRIVDVAGKLGLVLVPGVYHQVQRSVITMENARGYARWLGERYRDAPHIVWASYPEARLEFLPVLRELAAGLKEGDGGGHLITVHPDPAVTSSSFIHTEDWLDFNMIQTCVDFELIYKMVSEDYARTPPKPTIMAEGGYEGVEFARTQTAFEIRKQAYWSYLAGGYHCYAHNDNWTSPLTWRSWIDSPGAQHMTVCRRILTSLPHWWNMVPDQSLFVSGEGSWLFQNVAARSAEGDWAVVYLSTQTTVSIAMDKACAGNIVSASWIDPTTGEKSEIGTVPAANVKEFSTPPSWSDAILLLERRPARH